MPSPSAGYIQPCDQPLLIQAKYLAQRLWAAGEIAADPTVQQHLVGALLHCDDFQPTAPVAVAVIHPARDILRADPVLTLIEHLGLGREDRRGPELSPLLVAAI